MTKNQLANYHLEYYVKNKGTFDLYFEFYPSDRQLQFLIERNDILRATIWKRSSGEWIRVIDLI